MQQGTHWTALILPLPPAKYEVFSEGDRGGVGESKASPPSHDKVHRQRLRECWRAALSAHNPCAGAGSALRNRFSRFQA